MCVYILYIYMCMLFQVIKIKNIHSDQPIVRQVYADDGSVIIGSSVAARYGGKLLIGTVYQRALCCDLR